jgi:DUF917 family protein
MRAVRNEDTGVALDRPPSAPFRNAPFRLGAADLPALARGCAVLGTGGGGNVDTGLLAAARAIREYGEVPVLTLAELDDDAIVVPLSGIGAPTVAHEMVSSDLEAVRLRDEVERVVGRPMTAVMSSEIGGANGVAPVAWAARLGLPLVDADGMGRAFPEVQMVAMYVAGLPVNFIVLSDVVGNVSTLRPVDGLWSERLARALCVASGAHSLMADYILTAREARGAVIEGSVSRALAVGRCTEGAVDPLAALVAELGATPLLGGKIIDIERRTGGGFVRGSAVIEGVGDDRGRLLRLEIQNENLVAFEDGRVLATVPDLISVVDTQTADAISTESLRYGQRVAVLAWPCDPLWRTPRGLEVAGPRAFGYDLDYLPIEEISRGQ